MSLSRFGTPVITQEESLCESDAVRPQAWIAGMDGLRAIACLAVFAVHWQQVTGFQASIGPFDAERLMVNGNTGVAIFMILTGYLLAYPLFTTPPAARSSGLLSGFWVHRALRILPAYWVCLFALVILSGNYRTPGQGFDIAAHLLFLHNLFPQTLYSINSPFWALAVFVQYYLVYYLIVAALCWSSRLSDRAILIAFAATAVIGQSIVLALMVSEPPAMANRLAGSWIGRDAICLQHSLLIHLPIFWIGTLACWADARVSRRALPINDVLIAAAMGIVLALLATPLGQWTGIFGTRYHFPTVPVLLGLIVFLTPRTCWVCRWLEFMPIRLLGLVSYAFYLFHLPALKLIASVADRMGVPWRSSPILFGILVAMVTFCGCLLLYRWLESPLQSRFRSIGRRAKVNE